MSDPDYLRVLFCRVRSGHDCTGVCVTVLSLLSTYLSFPEIPAEVFRLPHTIKSATKLIYWELGASSRNEAVTHARELGLLEGWLVFPPHRVMELAPACGGLVHDGRRRRLGQVARFQEALRRLAIFEVDRDVAGKGGPWWRL